MNKISLIPGIGGMAGTKGPPIRIVIVPISPESAKAMTQDFAPASLTLLTSIAKRGIPFISSQAA